MVSSTTTSKIQERNTKYCRAILQYISINGHATNAEILHSLRKHFPDLSPTTVHRATFRLAQRGKIALAPPDLQGSMRYDAKIEKHDHFMCRSCGLLRDASIADTVKPLLESQLDGCHISGDIVVSGICKKCSLLQ